MGGRLVLQITNDVGRRRMKTKCDGSRAGACRAGRLWTLGVALATAATAFACPSIYEPLGIVNLEAMACETAVVATATGGSSM